MLREAFGRVVERMRPERVVREMCGVWGEGERALVIGVGKAGKGMVEGVVAGHPRIVGVELVGGSHPVPDAASEAAGRRLLRLVGETEADRIIMCVSGGASAMVAVPVEGVTLAEKAEVVARVMAAGAGIAEINCVRKHLSAIKGGRLAAAARVPVTTLVLSDVVGDDVSVVGSGLTVPDGSTLTEARDVIERWVGWGAVAESVRRVLESGEETPKVARPGDRVVLVAGIGTMVEVAADELGGGILGADVVEDVGSVAAWLAEVARRIAGSERVTVAGGEPTVVVPPGAGRSGRAAQLALLVARAIDGVDATVLVAGTDGVDGVSDAAGAVVDGRTWRALAARGVDGELALARCDAAAALALVGAAVVTGPTGVNHADLMIVCGRQGA